MSDQDTVEETIFEAKPTITESRERLVAKKIAKIEKTKQRAKEKLEEHIAEHGEVNYITIHADHQGLLYCKFLRGQLPVELRGKFTSKQRIIDICNRRKYIVKE
jgi:hypothetical protein